MDNNTAFYVKTCMFLETLIQLKNLLSREIPKELIILLCHESLIVPTKCDKRFGHSPQASTAATIWSQQRLYYAPNVDIWHEKSVDKKFNFTGTVWLIFIEPTSTAIFIFVVASKALPPIQIGCFTPLISFSYTILWFNWSGTMCSTHINPIQKSTCPGYAELQSPQGQGEQLGWQRLGKDTGHGGRAALERGLAGISYMTAGRDGGRLEERTGKI